MLMGMCLPMFNIHQGAVASICFNSYTNSGCTYFFQKKKMYCFMSGRKFTLFEVTSL